MTLRKILLNFKVFYYLNYLDIFLFFIQVQDLRVFGSLGVFSPTICNLINASYALELMLELSYREGDLYSVLTKLHNRFLCLFTLGILGIFGLDLFNLVALVLSLPRWELGKVLFRSLRCCRILITNSDLSAFCFSVLSVGPLFCENMIFGLVILYMHGMAGYLLFGSSLEIWATPISATITVQKLFLPFDLLDIMELTMEKVHKMSILFFFIYFLMSIIVSNLSLSIILEWHAQMFEELSQPTTVKKNKMVSHEILFNTIKERVISRNTNKKMTSFATIAKAKEISQQYISYRMYFKDKKDDYRMKFVDDIEHLSEKDLKACQKYSNIDLAALSKMINRQQKELTWEADFVEIARKDNSMEMLKPGTTFITKGESALRCFLIISGTIRVEMTNQDDVFLSDKEEVTIGSINLLGSACLTPVASKNQYTCRADTAVECIVFTQESILSEIDSDHAGQLLRMAHKTQKVLNDLFW
jgi:hypothetical protein